MALHGTEVKSIREGKANLRDAYGIVKNGEAFLLNAHIGPYSHGNIENHEALRTRKLLLHKSEVEKLLFATQQKGLTLVPTRIYFRHGRAKCELAIAKGKQDWDKRETERRREADREAKAAIVRSQRRAME
jgi:SsrA-binding protein